MNPIKCVIIDDDEVDRLMTVSLAKKYGQLKIAGIYDSAEKALALQDFKDIDVLFLDIELPGINGLEFRKIVNTVPACIFITAYPEHAVESFMLETFDYILKPLRTERFHAMIDKLEQFIMIREKAKHYENFVGGDYVFIREGYKETKVFIYEVLYLEALKDYTLIITSKKRHCVLTNIGKLLNETGFKKFIRIHRSFAVRKDVIKSVCSQTLILNNGLELPIGRSFRENLVGYL